MKQIELALSSSSTDTIYSVSEFTAQVKSLLESTIPATWVRGQVSNVRRQSSGHIYFTLKDESSQISAVLFRGNAGQQARFIQDGKQVIIFGDINIYEPRGTYQIIARWVLEDGIGKLQAEFEKLKEKLSSEGLFDKERKKSLPKNPKTVGIITSPTGAAIQDFISILKRRQWNGRIIVFPSLVQGPEASQDVIKQIKQAKTVKELDLLVISRGGGSLEDLWPFNEEPLVRALADCAIPTISAVGHEIDFTLCDFVADVRAETPSGAAELIATNYSQLIERLDTLKQKWQHLLRITFESHCANLKYLASQIKGLSPQKRLDFLNLRLDDLNRTLSSITKQCLLNNQHTWQQLLLRLKALAPVTLIQHKQAELKSIKKRLENLSVQNTLNRGYTLIKSEQKTIISSCNSLAPNQTVYAQFADGEAAFQVIPD